MTSASTGSAPRRVGALVRGQPASDGAGVSLVRLIGTASLPQLDPFLLLDEFGSDRPAEYLAGFPDHPHRGFETVTYMLAGRMRHADSAGNSGLLGPGSVQWMTAGRGIVHSEMPEQQEGLLQGFQLWVNLPARDKFCQPRYQDIPAEAIPRATPAPGVTARVIAGVFGGVTGPVDAPATAPLYLDLTLEPQATLSVALTPGHNALVYPFVGAAAVGVEGQVVSRGDLAVLDDGDTVTLAAAADGGSRTSGAASRLLLIAGRPLGEPVARYGPFVMNSEQQIREAIADFRAGRLTEPAVGRKA